MCPRSMKKRRLIADQKALGIQVRIALLHLKPICGDIPGNRSLIERAIEIAASAGTHWVVTPECAVCGYGFRDVIGTDWIEPQPASWMTSVCRKLAKWKVSGFLCHPERDRQSGRLHNTMFAIDGDGSVAGKHRKINVLPGSEAWAAPGTEVSACRLGALRVGMLICADVCTPGIYNALKADGAEVLVSSASWGPGPYEPSGEWERCSFDTSLPLFVSNRTGPDTTLDFTGAETVAIHDGRRVLSFGSTSSSVVFIEWDRNGQIVREFREPISFVA
jgi:predicted amidohydrolase